MITAMTSTISSNVEHSFDCTSSMMIGPDGHHYGNTKTTGGYDTTTGTLFTNEFWDDESYEIDTSTTTASFGDQA